MNIAAEKAEVIKSFEKVNDLPLVRAVKNLLDFAQTNQQKIDQALENSIDQGLKESLNSELEPHDVVMKGFRDQYKL